MTLAPDFGTEHRRKGESAGQERAVVIGAGLGGIAAALRMRGRGYDVTLVDRLDEPGGRARVFRKDGFIFDAGPTVLTAPFLFEELFALFGKDIADYIEIVPVEPWYRIRFHDGRSFDYGGTEEDMLREIEKFEPRDVDGYRRFMKATEDIYRVGFEELGDEPFLSTGSMLRIAPQMIRLQSYLSVYRRTSLYIKNDLLRRVFSFHPLLVGGHPFRTTSIYSLIHVLERRFGVHFPMGGTGALVQAMTRLMLEEGITLRLGETVSEIETTGGQATGVRLETGEQLPADLVISNADPPFVYKHLLRNFPRRKWTDRRVEKLKYSMGLFVLYFGTSRTYPDLAHHTIMLTERYKALIDEIFDGPDLPEDFSLYLHAPTRTDPSLAPPGHECFYVLAPVPNLQSPIDWSEAGPRLRDAILRELEETVCPGLRESLVTQFHVTPEYFRDELLSVHGSGFSVQPLLRQSAAFRFHNRSEEIPNLFFTGAGTHPGAGMPGVLSSAKVVENILDREGLPTS